MYDWEQRIATSSIPREMLNTILYKNVEAKNAEQRLKIVRLYLQGNRYQDASRELEQIVAEFPESKERFEATVLRLKQLSAQRLLTEAKLRRLAGQHELTYSLLEKFPSQNVAGELLQEVSEMLGELSGHEGAGRKAAGPAGREPQGDHRRGAAQTPGADGGRDQGRDGCEANQLYHHDRPPGRFPAVRRCQ